MVTVNEDVRLGLSISVSKCPGLHWFSDILVLICQLCGGDGVHEQPPKGAVMTSELGKWVGTVRLALVSVTRPDENRSEIMVARLVHAAVTIDAFRIVFRRA